MKMRKLDKNGDWTYGAGKGSYLTDEAAIEQNIATCCREWLNDCFFAMDRGIDWTNLLEHNQKDNLDQALRGVILSSYGVVGLNSLTLAFDGRAYSFTYNIDTIYSSGFTSQIQG